MRGNQSRTGLVVRSIAAVLTVFPTMTSAQVQVGCGTNPVQDWFLVNAQTPFRTIQGSVAQPITRNTGGTFSDGDWNIYVRPSDASVLTNSRGQANRDGRIELEINSSGPDLSSIFPTNTRVEASGLWVQDAGHDDKTELHPFGYIRTLDANPMHVFMGQDHTGRFYQTTLRNTQIFELDAAMTPRVVTPTSHPASNTLILHEHAQLSKGMTFFHLYPDYVELNASLDPWWFSDCETTQVVSFGDTPFYHGAINRSHASLLTETVRYSIALDSMQKVVFLSVDIDLTDPPTGQLAQSIWEYESSAGTVIGVAREIKNSRPHRFRFSMPYAPSLGYEQYRWTMNVFGTTTPAPDVQQNADVTASSYDRTMVMERRVYALEPSQISLNIQAKGTSATCTPLLDFRLDTTRLLPQIGLRAVRWRLQTLRDENGFAVSGRVDTLAPGARVDRPGFTAQAYRPSANDAVHFLQLAWKQLASGQPNLSQVSVIADVVTELGEQVTTARGASAVCGVGAFAVAQVHEYIGRILRQMRWRGEAYKAFKSASRADRPWLQAYWKWQNGGRLTQAEERALLLKVTEGSRLPASSRPKPELKRVVR